MLQAVEVTPEGGGDGGVSLGFAGPAAGLGVGVQGADVVELIVKCVGEPRRWGVAVAGLADVGVGAGAGPGGGSSTRARRGS